jgi:hypothetical protein
MVVQEIAKSNEYAEGRTESIISRTDKKDFDDFKKYYNNLNDQDKEKRDNDFRTYVDQEIKKDALLQNLIDQEEGNEKQKINKEDSDAIIENADISPDALKDLGTVRSLVQALEEYPNVDNPTSRALRRMIDEHLDEMKAGFESLN